MILYTRAWVTGKIGLYAALQGYDAIKVDFVKDLDYVVVLNRVALFVKE